jgi:hypothetical protein
MMHPKQSTHTIMMVRPANFGYNQETAANNLFQTEDGSLSTDEIRRLAQEEFDEMVKKIRSKDIEVIVVEDTLEPLKPDAIFPNNWISFHEDGRVVTYPMYSPLRQQERRVDVLDLFRERFALKEWIQMEKAERIYQYLEGTGSLVLDRVHRIAYACVSERTHPDQLKEFARLMDYEVVDFHSADRNGDPVYHTNVVMSIGERFALICMESVKAPEEKKKLYEHFRLTGKEVIEISLEQMHAFAGNLLQLRSRESKNIIVISRAGYDSLSEDQKTRLSKHGELLPVAIPTVEKYGGGSARCMIAEVFYP